MTEHILSEFFKPAMTIAPSLDDISHEGAENIAIEEKTEAAAEIQPPDDATQDNPYLKITEKISHRNNALFKVALWKMLDRDKSGVANQGILQSAPPLPLPNDQDFQPNLENTFGIPGKMITIEKDLKEWPLTRQFIANRQETELGQIPLLKNIEEVIQSGSQKNQREEIAPSKGMSLDEIAERWMERSGEAQRNTEQPESPLEEGKEPLWLPDSVTNAYVGNTLSKGARQVLEEAMRKGIVKLPPRTVDMVPTDENWVPPTEQGIIELEPELTTTPLEWLNGLADGLFAISSSLVTGVFGTPIGVAKGMGKSVIDGTYGTYEGSRNAGNETRRFLQNGNFYNPRTEIGKGYLEAFGKIMDFFIPVAPMPGKVAALQAGLKTAMPAIEHAATRAVQPIARTAGKTAEVIRPEAEGRALTGATHEALPREPVIGNQAGAILPENRIRVDDLDYDVNAPHYGVQKPPRTLKDNDPLLVDTHTKGKDSLVVYEGQEMPRTAMYNEMIEESFSNAKPAPSDRKPIAYVMGGGGGAGKGTILRRLKREGDIPEKGLVKINADDIKVKMPEYQAIKDAGDSRAAAIVHAESSELATRIRERAVTGKYDLLIDTTLGEPKYGKTLLKDLKEAGYEVHLIGVTAAPETAVVRSFTRGKEIGRYVPTESLLKAHKGFTGAFEEYAGMVDRAVLYENTTEMKTLAKKQGGRLEITDQDAYNVFKERKAINENANTLREIGRTGTGNGRLDPERR